MADNREISQDLSDRVERLEVLLTISRLMNATSNQERLINSIAGEVSDYLDADRCSIWFHDRLTDELYTHVATGIEKGNQIRLPSDRGIAGYVFKSGEVKNVQDASKEPLFSSTVARQTGYETHTMLAYPLRNRRGEAIGVMQLLNKKDDPGYFTQDDEDFLDEVAEQIGGVLDLVLRKDEMSHRNALLEAQMERLSSFEYLMEDRTAINTVFKYNRKVHYWTGMIGMAVLALMAVTSLVMVRSNDLRSLMLELHIGSTFIGYSYYYIYTDIASWITLAICGSGLLMYVYPPLNRWMKAKKDRISRFMLQESVRKLNQNRRVQEGLRKVLGGKDDGKGSGNA